VNVYAAHELGKACAGSAGEKVFGENGVDDIFSAIFCGGTGRRTGRDEHAPVGVC